MGERDYVLGTHDEELARLGLQHRIWRPHMLAAWQTAGFRNGQRLADLGCGPGYATRDLAEIVGRDGEVFGIERSERFVHFARGFTADLPQAQYAVADLLNDELPGDNLDGAWCRWVACFLPEPEQLIERAAQMLRPGGRLVIHDYVAYDAWRMMPARAPMQRFLAEVIANWRDAGGDPNVGQRLPQMCEQHGLSVEVARPLAFIIGPNDFMWEWPASFLESHVARLREMGRIDSNTAQEILGDFKAATADQTVRMLTPPVLELIATRR